MKSYTNNPSSVEEMRTNKFISMREIEARRDKLASRDMRPEFVEGLDRLLEVLDKVKELPMVLTVVDQHDIERFIEQYK